MNRCPITYLPCESGRYSKEGLHLLSPALTHLKDLPFGEDKQHQLVLEFSDKLSFSGVQPKLGAKLNIQKECFEIVRSGTYLLKLPDHRFPGLPQNEDLTMKLAGLAGISVPKHGMIYANDNMLVYFIERFDRISRKKLHVEDLGQLAKLSPEKKYDFSIEKIIDLINKQCTFPLFEKEKLFRIVLFNFLVGNEDMHVKNYSVIVKDGIVELAPAYDLVNSTIVIKKTKEEIALPLRGKKSNLTSSDLFDYFGKERLLLLPQKMDQIKLDLQECYSKWKNLIEISFLSDQLKEEYIKLVDHRFKRVL